MLINAHAIRKDDEIRFTYEGTQVAGTVEYASQAGAYIMVVLFDSMNPLLTCEYGLDRYDEVELLSEM